jgi:hypothetical protein
MNDTAISPQRSRCPSLSTGVPRLLIPDTVPLHSLWIAQHLHLVLECAEEVAILSSVRDLFDAHPDCRKGAEVSAFLSRSSPPIRILPDASGTLEAYFAKPEKTLILTGDLERWQGLTSLPQIEVTTTPTFIAEAEKIGLIADSFPLMQSLLLPGEITEWA